MLRKITIFLVSNEVKRLFFCFSPIFSNLMLCVCGLKRKFVCKKIDSYFYSLFIAMILNHLSITNYRNLPLAVLDFSANVNCFVGANGMGKSNVLDSIYYLSFCRGFATPQDALNIHHDSEYFILEGDYAQENGSKRHVCCSLKRGARKRLKIDGKDVKRISEHVGSIPLVMIAPADSALILGGSEERRRFMDMVIMQYSAPYLEALIRYERALKQRNSLMKQEAEPDASVLDVIEAMMAECGNLIYDERKVFVEAFQPIFLSLYQRLAGNVSEQVAMTYVSHGNRGDLQAQLRDWRSRERIVGYTLHGVHKDDLELTLNGFAVKREASQGQQKTYFIAMKLAQYVFLKNKGEHKVPLLLLDDIFDKLDASRVEQIVNYVSGDDFGQIFITDTRREHLDKVLAATHRDYKLFTVDNGEVRG